MTELTFLRVLLLIALLVAPFATRPSLPRSRWDLPAQGVAFLCSAIGLFSSIPMLTGAWLLYCIGSGLRYAVHRHKTLFSLSTIAQGVPFVFSVVAAGWLVGGACDLRILGYGPAYSFYASLHGNVLGWIMLGGVALLAGQEDQHRRLHLATVFVSLASFFLIAFGIDQLPALKPLGVLGVSIMLPLSQLSFLRRTRHRRVAFGLALVSLLGLALTLAFAWLNELSRLPSIYLLGARSMVSVHGVLNAVVVGPAWLGAVYLSRIQDRALELPQREGE
ncbi:MAG: YndJ family transporter [Myxococcota bacterium]